MNKKRVLFEDALSVHAGWGKILQGELGTSALEAVDNKGGRMNVQELRTIVDSVYAQKKTPMMFAKMADSVEPLTFGAFSAALWSAPNLDALFNVLQEYVIVLSAPIRITYKLDHQGNAELWIMDTESLNNESKVSYLGITLLIAVLIKIIHKVLCGTQVTLDVCLIEHRYREEENTLLEEDMSCTIKEGSPIRKLVIPKSFLHIPLTYRDKSVHFACVNLLNEEAERLKKGDLILQIYRFLRKQTQLGSIDGNVIAGVLNMNLRTLNRHLALRNTSYKGVVEKFKLEKALHLIDEGTVNMTEIAYQLGFSDLSTFSRAFKRWTGAAPLAVRHAAGNKERNMMRIKNP